MNNDTSSNGSVVCSGQVYSQVVQSTGSEIAVFRFMVVIITLGKVIYNRNELQENKLFALYFFLLIAGGIISASANIYTATNNVLTSDSIKLEAISNSIEIFGVILMDIFCGLMPNLFYSVYKTKLTKVSGEITQKYFLTNGIIIGILIVVLLVIQGILNDNGREAIVPTNVVLLVVTVYSFSFYMLVVVVLRNLEGRVRKIMWRYFFYYMIYASTIFIRNSFSITSDVHFHEPAYQEISWAFYPVDTICAGVTLMVIALFLREIKFSPHKSSSAKSTPKEESTSKGSSSTA